MKANKDEEGMVGFGWISTPRVAKVVCTNTQRVIATLSFKINNVSSYTSDGNGNEQREMRR